MASTLLNNLFNHLNNTPFDQLLLEWSSIEELQINGPNAFLYLDFLEKSYPNPFPDINNFEINEKMTPDYLESFFLLFLPHGRN